MPRCPGTQLFYGVEFVHERLECGDGLSIARTGDRVADLCCAGIRMGGLALGDLLPARRAAMSYL